MIASTLRQWISAAAVCALLSALSAREAAAADASSWDGDARSAVRLVAGGGANPRGDALRAGVEIRLAAGWKTYWRYPGDSGVPPAFDFSKSDNVKSIAIMWPAPHRMIDDGGTSIGYKGDVILPLRIVPQDPKRPVTLRLGVDYAICEKLCVPAKGSARLDLAPAPSSYDAPLAAAEAEVPKAARLGEAGPLAIRTVRREPGVPHPHVVVEVEAPAAPPLDLFVEGPTADWALPLPEPVAGGTPGLHRFVFELDGLPAGADATGARLRFTVVSGDNAIDVLAVPEQGR
jgi:DsbC/DsbD-like thiol-disulfide interchange protein